MCFYSQNFDHIPPNLQAKMSVHKKSSSSSHSISEKSPVIRKVEQKLWSILTEIMPDISIRKMFHATEKMIRVFEKYRGGGYKEAKNKSIGTTAHRAPGLTSSSHQPNSSSSVRSKSSSSARSKFSSKSSSHSSTKTTQNFSVKYSSKFSQSTNWRKSETKSNSKSKHREKDSSNEIAERANKSSKYDLSCKELVRLMDSDGFVSTPPARLKRTPKPVERFALIKFDTPKSKRLRSSNRRDTYQEHVDRSTERNVARVMVDSTDSVVQLESIQTTSQTVSTSCE